METLIPENLRRYITTLKGREALVYFLKGIGYKVGEQFHIQGNIIESYIDEKGKAKGSRDQYFGKLTEDGFTLKRWLRIGETEEYAPIGEFYTDGFEKLTKDAELKADITFSPNRLVGGIKNKNWDASTTLFVECDDISREAQIKKYIDFGYKTGVFPTALINSAGKSIHCHYKTELVTDPELWQRLQRSLIVWMNSDIAIQELRREMRLPGFQRFKNGEWNEVSLIYCNPDRTYTVDELSKALGVVFENMDETRWKIYGAYREGKITNVDNPIDIFTLPLDFFKKETEKNKTKVEYVYEGELDNHPNDWVRVLTKYLVPKLYSLPLEDQFDSSDFGGFCPDYKYHHKTIRSDSPFSDTNESGTTLVIFEDGAWFCHKSRRGGKTSLQFLQQVYKDNGVDKSLKGIDFIEFCKVLATRLGLSWKKLIKAEYRPLYTHKAAAEVTKEVIQEEISLRTPVEDFTTDVKPFNRDVVYIVRNNSAIADYVLSNNSVVLSCGFFGVKAGQEIKGFFTENTSKKKTLRVVVQPGEIIDNTAMSFFWAVDKFAKENDIEVKFLWYGQNSETAKPYTELTEKECRWETFSRIETMHYRIINKERNRALYRSLSQLSKTPDVVLNAQFIGTELNGIEKGKLTLISSPTGSGKSYFLKTLVNEMGNDTVVRSIGYRNNLLRQIAKSIDGVLYGDVESKVGNPNHLNRVLLCVDSLLKTPIESYRGAFLFFDEVEAVLKHAMLGSTVKAIRGKIIQRLTQIIDYVLRTNGTILAMEASLSDFTYDFFASIVGAENIVLVKNEYKKLPYKVTLGNGNSSAVTRAILDGLENGEKIIFVTDSQNQGEILHEIVSKLNPDIKVFRVDGHTSEEKEVKEFMADPNKFIVENQPDLLILSPSAESGVDITVEYFDWMAFHFVFLDTRAHLQLLNRYRVGIDRLGYCIDTSIEDLTNRSFDVECTIEDMFSNPYSEEVKESLHDDELREYYELPAKIINDPDYEYRYIYELMAKFKVRDNTSKSDLYVNLVEALRNEGHDVEATTFVKDDEILALKKEAKAEIEAVDIESYVNANISELTPETARQILGRINATKKQRVAARKFLLTEELPGVTLDREFFSEFIVKGKEKLYKQTKEFWFAMNPWEAKNKESESWRYHTGQPILSPNDIDKQFTKSLLLQRIAQLIENVETFNNECEQCIEVADWYRSNSLNVKRYLNISITKKLTTMQILSKLIKKFGLRFECVQRIGKRNEKRIDIFALVKDELYQMQAQLLNALNVSLKQRYSEIKTVSYDTVSSATVYIKENHLTDDTILTPVVPDAFDNIALPSDYVEDNQVDHMLADGIFETNAIKTIESCCAVLMLLKGSLNRDFIKDIKRYFGSKLWSKTFEIIKPEFLAYFEQRIPKDLMPCLS